MVGLALLVTERKNWKGARMITKKLDDSLCCLLSLSPLTLSSAFDQLQVQPRLLIILLLPLRHGPATTYVEL